MGTWGVHSFENDDAREWCQAYREMGLFVAKSTMEVALGDMRNGALRSDVAARAVAAVEAVSFAAGRGSPEAEEAFTGAPEANPNEAETLVPMAIEAIDAVLSGSELNVAWAENNPDAHPAWVAALTELKARVEGKPAVAEPSMAPASSPAAAPQSADLEAAVAALTAEVQEMRQEMREALIELARRIGGRGA